MMEIWIRKQEVWDELTARFLSLCLDVRVSTSVPLLSSGCAIPLLLPRRCISVERPLRRWMCRRPERRFRAFRVPELRSTFAAERAPTPILLLFSLAAVNPWIVQPIEGRRAGGRGKGRLVLPPLRQNRDFFGYGGLE